MELKFSVNAHISRPVTEVFEAIADPALLSRYFTTGGAQGRLEAGATVQWDFADFPGAFPVEVVEVEANRKIVLQWAADEPPSGDEATAAAGYKTTVTISFEPLDEGRTRVPFRNKAGAKHRPVSRRHTAIARAGRRCSALSRPTWNMALICARECTNSRQPEGSWYPRPYGQRCRALPCPAVALCDMPTLFVSQWQARQHLVAALTYQAADQHEFARNPGDGLDLLFGNLAMVVQ